MSWSYPNFHKSQRNHPIEELHKIARKYSRRSDEVDDLVQDLFLEAIRTERDISDEKFLPWAHGFLRNRAAFIARTEGRRRNREKAIKEQSENQNNIRLQFPENFYDQLSPALEKTARLINCGLTKKEIGYLLSITDTALRQRFTGLRKEWKCYLETNETAPEIMNELESSLNIGLLRRSLKKSFRKDSEKTIGSFDPDGNLLIFHVKSAHKKEIGGNNRNERKS